MEIFQVIRESHIRICEAYTPRNHLLKVKHSAFFNHYIVVGILSLSNLMFFFLSRYNSVLKDPVIFHRDSFPGGINSIFPALNHPKICIVATLVS